MRKIAEVMRKGDRKAGEGETRSVLASTRKGRRALASKARKVGGGMTGGDAIFAELEAMSRDEQEEIADRLLTWIDENELAP